MLIVGIYDEGTFAARGGGFSIKSAILGSAFAEEDVEVKFVRVGWEFTPELESGQQVVLNLPEAKVRSIRLREKARWLLQPAAVVRELLGRLKRQSGSPRLASDPDRSLRVLLQDDLEDQLFAQGVGLMLFLEAAEVFVNRMPYVTYLWEIAHFTQPDFPEIRSLASWTSSEQTKRNAAARAFRVVCGTTTGKQQLISAYGLPEERVEVVPFPVTFFKDPVEDEGQSAGRMRYILYPANFWPHKNHVVLINAMEILKAQGLDLKLVLTGTDKGNLDFVRNLVREKALGECVEFVGFVDRAQLSALYQGALAMVFPTLIGPDNLPPLEAMAHGCPVLQSDIAGARDQLSDAALFFDPFDPVALAGLLRTLIEDSGSREQLRLHGFELVKRRDPTNCVENLRSVCRSFAPFAELTDWSRRY